MADLEAAKRRLSDVLRDKLQKYWDLMKSWYRRKITKEDFDLKAKTLLGDSNVHLHNEFLFAILVKCQVGEQLDSQPAPRRSISPHPQAVVPPGKPKPKKQKIIPITEVPHGALDLMQYNASPKVQLIGRDLDTIMLCSHELLLPDMPTLHTRMLLGAWEAGLDAVSDEAAQLLMLSIQYFLKNVIQTVIAHRTSWRTRNDRFQHSFGSGLASRGRDAPSERQSVSRYQGDIDEAEIVALTSRSTSLKQVEPITLFHLRDALLTNCQCIPVHTVYACNMERILARMWHPSREEEEQKKTVEQWKRTIEPQVPFVIINNTYS